MKRLISLTIAALTILTNFAFFEASAFEHNPDTYSGVRKSKITPTVTRAERKRNQENTQEMAAAAKIDYNVDIDSLNCANPIIKPLKSNYYQSANGSTRTTRKSNLKNNYYQSQK